MCVSTAVKSVGCSPYYFWPHNLLLRTATFKRQSITLMGFGDIQQSGDTARNMQPPGQAVDWLGQAISLMPHNTPYPKQNIELG
ncbi:MAG: hypothetical protein C0620_02500 [Desulfuromonas sp.]|nr:MAG: hypothetical protein C0620_02500 [Desulfuromonas sp.]